MILALRSTCHAEQRRKGGRYMEGMQADKNSERRVL
jgi:hypothetical protein